MQVAHTHKNITLNLGMRREIRMLVNAFAAFLIKN